MQITEYESYQEQKSHTEEGFPYNTYLCSIPLDFTEVPLHWHSEMELIIVKKGEGIISADLTAHKVHAGDMVFLLPGQLHAIRQAGDQHMEYENILFKPSLLSDRKSDLCSTDYIMPLLQGNYRFPTLISRKLPYYDEIKGCIDSIDGLCSERPFAYQLQLKGLLFQLFFVLFSNNQSKRQPKQQKSLEKIKMILKYIEENYGRVITVEEMATLCYYSKSHFMKFFKEHMGMGFIQYLNDYRLTMAYRLLLVSGDSILTIATNTGYDNLSYFNRLFKRKYRITPSQLRKNA